MAEVPSLKGVLITEVAEDLCKRIDEGALSRSDLERRLTADDRAILELPIQITAWYGVSFYAHCAELLRDTAGEGRHEYLRQRGLAKGRRLIEAGLYQQMEYATRSGVREASSPEERFKAYGRDLRLMVTLSQSLLNFTRWSATRDPQHAGRYLILVEEAEAYPEVLAWATEGLIESMAETHGLGNLWHHRRPTADRLEFYMARAL